MALRIKSMQIQVNEDDDYDKMMMMMMIIMMIAMSAYIKILNLNFIPDWTFIVCCSKIYTNYIITANVNEAGHGQILNRILNYVR